MLEKVYTVLTAQGLKTKSGERAPAPPPPLPTEKKVEKGPLFAQNDPPHKNPGYGPGRGDHKMLIRLSEGCRRCVVVSSIRGTIVGCRGLHCWAAWYGENPSSPNLCFQSTAWSAGVNKWEFVTRMISFFLSLLMVTDSVNKTGPNEFGRGDGISVSPSPQNLHLDPQRLCEWYIQIYFLTWLSEIV